jgi:hypothetical protein
LRFVVGARERVYLLFSDETVSPATKGVRRRRGRRRRRQKL